LNMSMITAEDQQVPAIRDIITKIKAGEYTTIQDAEGAITSLLSGARAK
jgi:hypothetical protein